MLHGSHCESRTDPTVRAVESLTSTTAMTTPLRYVENKLYARLLGGIACFDPEKLIVSKHGNTEPIPVATTVLASTAATDTPPRTMSTGPELPARTPAPTARAAVSGAPTSDAATTCP